MILASFEECFLKSLLSCWSVILGGRLCTQRRSRDMNMWRFRSICFFQSSFCCLFAMSVVETPWAANVPGLITIHKVKLNYRMWYINICAYILHAKEISFFYPYVPFFLPPVFGVPGRHELRRELHLTHDRLVAEKKHGTLLSTFELIQHPTKELTFTKVQR